MKFKKIAAGLALSLSAFAFTACSGQAQVVSSNVSREADEFKVDRRIIAINMITDKYLFEITGKCSIETEVTELTIVCKVGPNEYQKHFVEFSNGSNIAMTIEQLRTSNVDSYQYSIVFRPEQVVPTVIR